MVIKRISFNFGASDEEIHALEALKWTVKSKVHTQKTSHFDSFDTWTSFNYKIIFQRTIYRHVS